ncbi:MAG: glycoside hydrolase [Phycisphaerales bacterium]|nr:glycoside hydrolase [Phycisphaerales bacterium]
MQQPSMLSKRLFLATTVTVSAFAIGCQTRPAATSPTASQQASALQTEAILQPNQKTYIAYWQRINQDQDGRIIYDDILRARDQAERNRAWSATADASRDLPWWLQETKWVFRGPTNISGRTRTLLFDPNNSDSMLMGGVTGGLWKSTNQGVNWVEADPQLPALQVCSLQRDPSDDDIIYAGTGEGPLKYIMPDPTDGWISNYLFGGDGIFKSEDNGATWTQLNATAGWAAVAQIAVTNRNASGDQRIFIAGESIIGNYNGYLDLRNGIAWSEDGGASWTLPANVSVNSSGNGMDVALLETDGDQELVASVIDNSYKGSVFYSEDSGTTWTQSSIIDSGGGSSSFRLDVQRIRFATGPASLLDGGVVLAIAGKWQGDTWGGTVYLSMDSGQTFYQVSDDWEIDGCDYWKSAIWISPTPVDGNYVICGGGVDVMRTLVPAAQFDPDSPPTSSSWTWSSITNWQNYNPPDFNLPHADYHVITADPGFNGTDNKRVWFTTDAGLWTTADISTATTTTGWSRRGDDYATTQFFGLDAQLTTPYDSTGSINMMLSGGLQDNGTLMVNSNSSSSMTTNTNTSAIQAGWGDGVMVAIHPVKPKYVFGGYTDGDLWRSRDHAQDQTHDYLFFGPSMSGQNWVFPMVLDSDETDPKLLVGGTSLHVLDDPTESQVFVHDWIEIGSASDMEWTPNSPVSAIATNPKNPAEIWVGFNNGEVVATKNGLARPGDPDWPVNWLIAHSGTMPPGRCVTRIVFDPSKAVETAFQSPLYVATGGYGAGNVSRFQIDEGDQGWTDVTGSGDSALPSLPVIGLAVHPKEPAMIFAGTTLGLYRTIDGGATWSMFDESGPGPVNINGLHFATDAPKEVDGDMTRGDLSTILAVGTHGRGIWTIDTGLYFTLDFDRDCDVDIEDLLNVISAWGTPDGDVNGDDQTNITDLLYVIENWGIYCTQ